MAGPSVGGRGHECCGELVLPYAPLAAPANGTCRLPPDRRTCTRAPASERIGRNRNARPATCVQPLSGWRPQVRAELNAEGRDLVMWVDALGHIGRDKAPAKARERQRRQQEQPPDANGPARGNPRDDIDIDTANRVLNQLHGWIDLSIRNPAHAIAERTNGCVLRPVQNGGATHAWKEAAAGAQRLLRGLRAEGGAMRLGLSVRLQVRQRKLGGHEVSCFGYGRWATRWCVSAGCSCTWLHELCTVCPVAAAGGPALTARHAKRRLSFALQPPPETLSWVYVPV